MITVGRAQLRSPTRSATPAATPAAARRPRRRRGAVAVVTALVDDHRRCGSRSTAGGARSSTASTSRSRRRGTVGLVGESGSGKTLICRSLLGLLPPGVRDHRRRRPLDGARPHRAHRPRAGAGVRGTDIGAVFQDPASYLNPSITRRPAARRGAARPAWAAPARRQAAGRRAVHRLGLQRPDVVYGQYPHELSGGMLQRVLIAIAIAARARPAHRRRGDDRPRRDDPGRDPRPARRAAARRPGSRCSSSPTTSPSWPRSATTSYVLQHGRVVEHGATRDVLADQQRPVHPAPRREPPARSASSTPAPRRWRDGDAPAPRACDDVARRARPPAPRDHPRRRQPDGRPRRDRRPHRRDRLREDDARPGRARAGAAWPPGASVVDGDDITGLPSRARRRAAPRRRRAVRLPGPAAQPRPRPHRRSTRSPRGCRSAATTRRRSRRGCGPRRTLVGLDHDLLDRLPGDDLRRPAPAGGDRPGAWSSSPTLLLCDEPVSALDASTRIRILELLVELRASVGVGILLISHDLGDARRPRRPGRRALPRAGRRERHDEPSCSPRPSTPTRGCCWPRSRRSTAARRRPPSGAASVPTSPPSPRSPDHPLPQPL